MGRGSGRTKAGRRRSLHLIAAGAAVALLPAAARAMVYWDTNGFTAGAGGPTPTGTWGVDSYWNDNDEGTGTFGAVIGPWASGEYGIFAAGDDAIGTYTVNVSGTQQMIGVGADNGDVTLSGGTLRYVTSFTLWLTAETGSKLTIQSPITSTATGPLVKTGGGTVVMGTILAQPNTFTNGMNFTGGVTEFQGENSATAGAANALGAAPASVISNALQFRDGAILRSYMNSTTAPFVLANRGVLLNTGGGGFDVATSGASLTYSGVISGTGRFIKTGPGELRLVQNSNTWSGGTTVLGGVLAIPNDTNSGAGASNPIGRNPGSSAPVPGSILLDGGGIRSANTSVSLAPFLQSGRGIDIGANGGSLNVSTATAFLSYDGIIRNQPGVTTGIVTKLGPGELQLTGANTVTRFVINEGVLGANAGSVGSGSEIVLNGGTFRTLGNHSNPSKQLTVNAAGGGVIVPGFTATYGNVEGPGNFTKSGGLPLIVNRVRVGALSVNENILRIAPNSANSATSVVTGITTVGSAKLDLTDNKLIVDGGDVGSWNGSAYTGVTGKIQTGRGNGSWNGAGIVTSKTDATTGVLTTLAVATADAVGRVGDTFGGVSVGSGDVLIMYTWGGDADLNGELNGDDYFYLDSNILAVQSGATGSLSFHNGDFNYDGELNGDDYFILDSNILQVQASGNIWPTGAGAGGLASVPEPAALSSVLVALIAGRRRRRG